MKRSASDPTTWLVDLGNTRLKWMRAEPPGSHCAQAVAYGPELDADQLDAAFAEIRAGDRVWLASVAGSAATTAVEFALSRRGAQVERATTKPVFAGVRIAYTEPSRLGVDRFLAMLAAHARAAEAWLIASVGTALTIDLLDRTGTHHGGLIVPSPTLMRESLSQRAQHLPREGGAVVDFAADTVDALASGAILSARALIARSLRAGRLRIGARPSLLIAGGGAHALLDGWRINAERSPDLVLEGLAIYAAASIHRDHAR